MVGDVKGFHRYKVHNGASVVRCKRYTLNMGKKIPEVGEPTYERTG